MIFEHNDRTKERLSALKPFMDAISMKQPCEQMDAFRAEGNPWQVPPSWKN